MIKTKWWKVTDSCAALESIYLWQRESVIRPTVDNIQEFTCFLYLWMAETAVKNSLFATGGIKVDELFIIIANDYKVVILLFTFKVISGIKLWQ